MQRARGFTLLEVVAGLGLAMVLAGVGAVQLVALVQTERLAGAAREVATALRLARGIALEPRVHRGPFRSGACPLRDARTGRHFALDALAAPGRRLRGCPRAK